MTCWTLSGGILWCRSRSSLQTDVPFCSGGPRTTRTWLCTRSKSRTDKQTMCYTWAQVCKNPYQVLICSIEVLEGVGCWYISCQSTVTFMSLVSVVAVVAACRLLLHLFLVTLIWKPKTETWSKMPAHNSVTDHIYMDTNNPFAVASQQEGS